MTVIAGVDVGNATTEVVLVAGGKILGAGRVPTRGRKGSAGSLRGAAALVRRLERQLRCTVTEARIAPLRAVDTAVVTVPDAAVQGGRLRVLAAGVPTPGGAGFCAGPPLLLGGPVPPGQSVSPGARPVPGGNAGPPGQSASPGARSVPGGNAGPPGQSASPGARPVPGGTGGGAEPSLPPGEAASPGGAASRDADLVAVVPAGLRYDEAAARLRALLADGVRIGAVLVAGDEGVLVANRLRSGSPGGSPGGAVSGIPVIDQVDAAAAAACRVLAVEVRPPGHTLRLLADPVALGARLGLAEGEAADAVTVSRALADHANAVVGLLPVASDVTAVAAEPWVMTAAEGRLPLRAACPRLAGWPVGAVSALGVPALGTGAGSGASAGASAGETLVDDLFAVDLAAAAAAATARPGSTGRAVLVASLSRVGEEEAASVLRDLLGIPVRSPVSEPAAARLGALTTPGARPGATVVDLGAGTIDVTGPAGTVVAAGAGELLTAAVAEMLAIPRASADWVKRGPCVRVDGDQRFEGEDGSRGFLDVPAPPSAAGMLAVEGPGGWLPFDRHRGPGEWRAIRLRLKQAVLAANFGRAVRSLGQAPAQVLVVGGPAGDEELLGVLARSLPDGVAAGRGDVGGTCPGGPLGHRYAVALGLALAAR